MWPLFTERWERLRSETRALSRLLHCRRTHQPLQQLPLATPLLYGKVPTLLNGRKAR